MTRKQIRHMIEVQPFFWILATLLLFSLLVALQHSDPRSFPTELKDGWKLAGEPVDELPERHFVDADEPTVLTRMLGEQFDEVQSISFYTVYEDVSVQINNDIIYTYQRPKAESLVKAPASYLHSVTLPDNSSGKTLTLRLTCPYSMYANHIGPVYCGTPEQIRDYITRSTIPKFIMACGLLFIAAVFAILAIFMRFHVSGHTGMYSLSLALLVLAVFLASEQTSILLSMYNGTSYVAIQCISYMLFPIMYTRYLYRSHKGRQKIISRALFVICIANMCIVVTLQLLRIADMPEMIAPTRVLCIVMMLYIFVLELIYHHRAPIILFAVAMIYGMFRYFRAGVITWLFYPGIYSYIYILGYRLINTVIRSKLQDVQLRTELEVSRSELATVQITSHFFYHTLDSIRALIKIDSNKAYKMTGDFAKYLRYRVDGVERMEEQVPFSRELRSIRAYTDIKQAQLGQRFHMEFDVSAEDFQILPLTVQPLVENSVIHAVQKRKDGGIVRLVCTEQKRNYHIEVIDNGPGDTFIPKEDNERHSSTAIHNVNTRLAQYGIAPVRMAKNELGGMTASLDMPKLLKRKDQ